MSLSYRYEKRKRFVNFENDINLRKQTFMKVLKFIKKFRKTLKESRTIFAKHLKSSRSFSMSYKLDMPTTILLILSQLKRSLQIELSYYFFQQGDLERVASKSAFVQARQKIDWRLFQDLNDRILSDLSACGLYQIRQWGYFQRVAIDGFKIGLPQTEELSKVFGVVKNQHVKETVMGSCALALDLESGYILRSDMEALEKSEKQLVIDWLESDRFSADHLLIYDRFYIGYAFAYRHNCRNISFIMRIRKNWNKATQAFIASGESERIVTIKIPEKALTDLKRAGYQLTGKDTMTLRLCKGVDDKGDEVYYATNVLDNERLSIEEIHINYGMRWESETAIDALKNKLQLAVFSGELEKVVRQDFHATICIFNLSQVIYNSAMEKLIEKEEDKLDQMSTFEQMMSIEQWPLRKVNRQLSIGLFGFLIFELFDLKKKNWKKTTLQFIEILLRFPEKVRKGRSFPIKYKMNKARGKFWYYRNFKRAA